MRCKRVIITRSFGNEREHTANPIHRKESLLLSMNTLLKIGKWYWIGIFILASLIEVKQTSQYHLWFYYTHIPLLLFIILLIFHRNWLSWLFMIFVCVYGLYDLFLYAPLASSPTRMDFGFNLSYFYHESRFSTPVRLTTNPVFFYFFTLVFFFTKPVRRKYFK